MLFEGIKTVISNNHNLIKDSLWSIFGSVIGKGSAFISGIFIARLLGKISYGEYSMLKMIEVSVVSPSFKKADWICQIRPLRHYQLRVSLCVLLCSSFFQRLLYVTHFASF